MGYKYDIHSRKKSNKKKVIFLIGFILLTLIFASVFYRSSKNKVINKISNIILTPFEVTFHGISGVTSNISNNFNSSKKLQQENDELKSQVQKLELSLLESSKILDENESLKKMLDIKKSFQHFDIKLSKVIFREHDNWTQTFKIDIGSKDGVKLNQAVVHVNGLVGYISKVEESTSTVTTMLDPICSVSVNISTINEPAMLQGDLALKSNNRLKLNFIPLDVEISISDMLYTSGLGSIYPGSIPVGKIVEIVHGKNDINRYAIVEPNVNIRTISEVGVIIN